MQFSGRLYRKQQQAATRGEKVYLGTLLLQLGVSEKALRWALSGQSGLTPVDLAGLVPPREALLGAHEWHRIAVFPIVQGIPPARHPTLVTARRAA